MLFAEYMLKHYEIELRLFSNQCLSKYIHEFLFHGSYMNIFDRKDMFYVKILKGL